jgi:bifunctional DNA-binding transcriptional regulator/antitoxin component of YhaV-PrlF toxin-antitoxin module
MKVLFDTKKVQKLGRIVLSETLLRNADLHEGDPIEIYFDVVTKQIVIQKAEPSSGIKNTAGSKEISK